MAFIGIIQYTVEATAVAAAAVYGHEIIESTHSLSCLQYVGLSDYLTFAGNLDEVAQMMG